MDFNIKEFGAQADGSTNNAKFIQKAIDAAHLVGGRVIIPSGGTFMSGSIQLKSKVNLFLEKGAMLLASSDYDDYTESNLISNITYGKVIETVLPQRAFISGFQADDMIISGEGIIDGNAEGFIEKHGQYIHVMRRPAMGRDQYLERPFTIYIIESERVVIKDVTITNPAFWALRITGCNNSEIHSIKILTDRMVPNADGIDIDRCRSVLIKDCTLITADDCISLKSCSETNSYGDLSDVVIKNCYMKTTSGAITIGTESVGLIKNILVENCIVEDSNRGFAVRAREGGLISNVKFVNSKVSTRSFNDVWWGHGEALHVTAFSWSDPNSKFDGNIERGLEGKVQNIVFENLEIDTEAGILNWAAKKGLIKNINFRNIKIKIGIKSKWPSRIDLRPNDISPIVFRPHNAIEVVNCENIKFENIDLTWDSKTKDRYGATKFIENSSEVLFFKMKEQVN